MQEPGKEVGHWNQGSRERQGHQTPSTFSLAPSPFLLSPQPPSGSPFASLIPLHLHTKTLFRVPSSISWMVVKAASGLAPTVNTPFCTHMSTTVLACLVHSATTRSSTPPHIQKGIHTAYKAPNLGMNPAGAWLAPWAGVRSKPVPVQQVVSKR